MGLFDSLPAPTNQAPLKRNAESLAAPLQDSSDSKKPRADAAANAAMNGGSGGGPAWGGSLEAASSEDKGSRLTMEGGRSRAAQCIELLRSRPCKEAIAERTNQLQTALQMWP
jgi:hypothetical protein